MSLQVPKPLHNDRFPSNQKCQKNCCNKKTVAIKNGTGTGVLLGAFVGRSAVFLGFFGSFSVRRSSADGICVLYKI